MADIVAIRIEPELLKKIRFLGMEKSVDRSTIIRELIRKGLIEMLKEKAARLYIEGRITLSRAAHRAGLSIWEMEKYLVEKGFKSDYSIEDLEKEMKLLK